jgi:predicted ATPase
MEKKKNNNFFKSIKLKNFLSYGPKGVELKLKPLNVFIGANSSGKSNLIEALRILRAAAQSDPKKDISGVISERDGIGNWIWKGERKDSIAEIQVFTDSDPRFKYFIKYGLELQESNNRSVEIVSESLIRQTDLDKRDPGGPKADYYYALGAQPTLATYISSPDSFTQEGIESLILNISEHLRIEKLNLNQSILSQRKDPDRFPNVTYLANQFSKIQIYRGWNLEYDSPIRNRQDTDQIRGYLFEDASNLDLVISELIKNNKFQNIIYEHLERFYPNFRSLHFQPQAGVQLFIEENGLKDKVPATRLSDGFIRYLCLLAILCHPDPPPVICLEEPELNMHPDIIPTIAELLVDASKRTQLFVTTHSDLLVSALSNYPESIVVCDREENGTQLRRLKKKDLGNWLNKYTLGDIWAMNKIGGNP